MSNEMTSRAMLAKATARRWFLQQCPLGLGAIALGSMASTRVHAQASADPLAPKQPPHTARAKRVIYLFMAGAPSHLDLFDPKPELTKYDGKLPPADLLKGYRAAFINPNSNLLGPRYKFQKFGNSGAELATILPNIGAVADDFTIIKSMRTEAINHAPAQIMMNTGSQQFGRPSMGSWVLYGLGSESRDLPGFVVLQSGTKGPAAGRPTGGVAFSHRSTKRSLFEVAPTRFCISPILKRSMRRCSEKPSTPLATSIASGIARSEIQRSTRASTLSRWLSACRPACRA